MILKRKAAETLTLPNEMTDFIYQNGVPAIVGIYGGQAITLYCDNGNQKGVLIYLPGSIDITSVGNKA